MGAPEVYPYESVGHTVMTWGVRVDAAPVAVLLGTTTGPGSVTVVQTSVGGPETTGSSVVYVTTVNP